MTAFVGAEDQCRHCGHKRAWHPHTSTRGCSGAAECPCVGFGRSNLTWTPSPSAGGWEVASVDSSTKFLGLPSESAALELAYALSDIDDMLARIQGVSA